MQVQIGLPGCTPSRKCTASAGVVTLLSGGIRLEATEGVSASTLRVARASVARPLVRPLRRRRLPAMSWWWLLLFLLIPLAWVLLQTVVGVMTPPDASGRFYLRTQLKSAGVLHLVPDGCIRELVDQDLSAAHAMSKMTKEGVRTEMVSFLDSIATLVAVWITGEQLPIQEDGVVPRTLVKYGIERGALKRHTRSQA